MRTRSLLAKATKTLLIVMAVGLVGGTARAAILPGGSARGVQLETDLGGRPIFDLPALAPGESSESCVSVNAPGVLPGPVRLYGTTGGTGLARHLQITVMRGVAPSTKGGSCQGFVPDDVDHFGAGAGVVFRGTLADFPDDFESGLSDPGSPGSWAAAGHVYRFVVTLEPVDWAMGLTVTQTFVWEARSS